MFKAGEMTGRALKRKDEIKEPKRGRRTSDQINNPPWRVCALAWRQPLQRSISCQSAFTAARFGVTESIKGKETRQSFSRLAFGLDFSSAEPPVSLQNHWDKKVWHWSDLANLSVELNSVWQLLQSVLQFQAGGWEVNLLLWRNIKEGQDKEGTKRLALKRLHWLLYYCRSR